MFGVSTCQCWNIGYLVPVVFCYFNFFVLTRSCHSRWKKHFYLQLAFIKAVFGQFLGLWICRICRKCEFRRSRGLECTTRPRLALQTGSFMGHFRAAFCLLIFVYSLRFRCNTNSNIVQTINWVKNSSFTQSWHMFYIIYLFFGCHHVSSPKLRSRIFCNKWALIRVNTSRCTRDVWVDWVGSGKGLGKHGSSWFINIS